MSDQKTQYRFYGRPTLKTATDIKEHELTPTLYHDQYLDDEVFNLMTRGFFLRRRLSLSDSVVTFSLRHIKRKESSLAVLEKDVPTRDYASRFTVVLAEFTFVRYTLNATCVCDQMFFTSDNLRRYEVGRHTDTSDSYNVSGAPTKLAVWLSVCKPDIASRGHMTVKDCNFIPTLPVPVAYHRHIHSLQEPTSQSTPE